MLEFAAVAAFCLLGKMNHTATMVSATINNSQREGRFMLNLRRIVVERQRSRHSHERHR